jgi:hypothetical protein
MHSHSQFQIRQETGNAARADGMKSMSDSWKRLVIVGIDVNCNLKKKHINRLCENLAIINSLL